MTSIKVTAPTPSISQPTEADGYLAVAHELFQALDILSAATIPPRAAAYVGGHVLECLLTAFLVHQNRGANALRGPEIRHDLVSLWKMASTKGLNVELSAPNGV